MRRKPRAGAGPAPWPRSSKKATPGWQWCSRKATWLRAPGYGVAGLAQPVALVGVSEQGYLSPELTATGPGGHSSMPLALTSVGWVAAAVARLEAQPFPARLDGGASSLLAYLAPAVPFGKRLVFANQWLFEGVIKRSLAATPLRQRRPAHHHRAHYYAGQRERQCALCAGHHRSTPVLMDQAARESLHGTNERLRPAACQRVMRFYAALIRNMP